MAAHRKVIRFDMGWAVCASLVYHALMFLVLSKTSLYYPAFGTVARFDFVWVSPVSAPLALAATEEAGTPSTAAANSAQSPLLPDPGWDEPAPSVVQQRDEPESAVPPRDAAEDEGTPAPLVNRKDSSSAGRIHKQSGKPRQERQSLQKIPVPDPPSAPFTPVSQSRIEKPLQESEEPAQVTLAQSQQAMAQFSSAKAAKPDTQPADFQDDQKQLARLEAFRQLQNEQALALAERMKHEAERERITQQQRVKKEKDELELKAAKRARLEKMEREAERKRIAQQQKMTQEKVERELKTAERARLERMEREAERERITQQQRVTREEEQRELKAERARLDQAKKEAATRDRAAARLEPERRTTVPTGKNNEPNPLAATKTRGGGGLSPPAVSAQPASPPQDVSAAKETAGPKPSHEPQEKRGMVIPSVHGDLKLVIDGNDAFQVLVTFTSYPKSRRGRPLTKIEARREQKILPVLGKTQEGTREAVIETALEGIYVFRVESEGDKATTASFTLKIFELSTKKRIKEFGARKFSGRTVLLKILMPEAILWEDESAFTGSMEDSESVLKFNAQTGLYWKEYNEPI